MQLVCPSNSLISIPLYIGIGSSETGPRLGGRAPENVRPAIHNPPTQYFLTIPFAKEPKLEMSVFLCTDFNKLLERCNVLNQEGLIQVVIHPESHRGSSLELLSSLTEHPLVLQEVKDDSMASDEGEALVTSCHKIGGRPYFIREGSSLEIAIEKIMEDGFIHILQMDFPPVEGDMGTVQGDWPFGDGMFHLFGKSPFGQGNWYWFWEH